jgi:hypothetical protein
MGSIWLRKVLDGWLSLMHKQVDTCDEINDRSQDGMGLVPLVIL